MNEEPTERERPSTRRRAPTVRQVPVDKIRPEAGLGRQRDREGHKTLCRSIEQFGVLTPITVRRARDGSGEYLLIKGQGRTLACSILGITKIPAIVVDDDFAETQKVQQFLVENVARLRMSPVDRALLIARARQDGEETAEVAKRFGVSYSTVRRLEAQLDGATPGEVKALRDSNLRLSLHAVIARHVSSKDRAAVIRLVAPTGIRATELDTLFAAIGWPELVQLGDQHRAQRFQLLKWSCETFVGLPRMPARDRITQLALLLPLSLPTREATSGRVASQ